MNTLVTVTLVPVGEGREIGRLLSNTQLIRTDRLNPDSFLLAY